jgi:hypothetical protein
VAFASFSRALSVIYIGLTIGYARKKDQTYFVVLSMRANGVWSETTPKKELAQTTQERMVHKS